MKNRSFSSGIMIKKLVLSGLFMAIGMILPFFTGQIPAIGSALLPMHLPVYLCGLICGWQYGLAVGVSLPIIRSLIFAMPPIFPTALAMAAELAAYGLVSGLVYAALNKKGLGAVYLSLILAMLSGRAVWGLMQLALLGIMGTAFSWQAFFAGAFATAVPGIVIQLVLIPSVMMLLHAAGAVRFGQK